LVNKIHIPKKQHLAKKAF